MSTEEDQREDISNKADAAVDTTTTTSAGKRKLNDEESANTIDDTLTKRRKSEENEATISSNNAVVKTEPEDQAVSSDSRPSTNIPVTIKTEPVEETVESSSVDDSSLPATSSSASSDPAIVKTEPADSPVIVKTEPSTTSQTTVGTVSSSTMRMSCRFGIRCYRTNPMHRNAEAHPGDSDYRRPDFPAPPLGTPACPFGNICYRRNPNHFQQFSHPSDFNSEQNIRNRLRQRRAQPQNAYGSTAEYSDSGSDVEDPFHDDSESDAEYTPGANVDDDEDEDDDLEFNSERQNCDLFD